jgi:predicted XRE-type DNA-binding protein
MKKINKHRGAKLDDFLKDENLLEEVEASAIKQTIVIKLQKEMLAHNISKAKMAAIMQTSRSSLDRLLDPENTSVTLNTLVRAASVLNKRVNINLTNM